MTARVVDARFAGGALRVDVSEVVGARVVSLALPGTDADMFPDEARTLAVALIEAAAQADAPEREDWP